jgi:8-oxo-dGTP pyrophosphatase MutT (NUDIX family)
MDDDAAIREVMPKHKTRREIEEEIALQNRRDLREWYELHKNDLNSFNGGSSEFNF